MSTIHGKMYSGITYTDSPEKILVRVWRSIDCDLSISTISDLSLLHRLSIVQIHVGSNVINSASTIPKRI